MSRPLPRWVRVWLPLVALAVAGAAGLAVLLARSEPEPIGLDTAPIPTDTTGRDGVLSFTILAAECGFENVISAERIPADGQFCLVELQIAAAVSGETAVIEPSCQFLITDAQERFTGHEEGTLAGADPGPFTSGLQPGKSRAVELMFDIPTGAQAVGVELHSSCESDGVRLAFAGEDPLRGGG